MIFSEQLGRKPLHCYSAMMMNRLYNGEMQAKNPAGLPPTNPERLMPREAVHEQEWWLRSNDRRRETADPSFTYFPQNTLIRSNFQAGAIEKDHSRRVFKELARQGHSFSESNLQALKQDRNIRKSMQKRHWEVMGGGPKMPGPANKSFLRKETKLTEDALSALGGGSPPQVVAKQMSRVASMVSACPPDAAASKVSACAPGAGGSMVSAAAASRLSATAPLSMVSASQPAFSRISASRPMGERQAAAEESLAAQAEEARMSQLSVSDFYAWRPRLLR